jgi:hypothetical protein
VSGLKIRDAWFEFGDSNWRLFNYFLIFVVDFLGGGSKVSIRVFL